MFLVSIVEMQKWSWEWTSSRTREWDDGRTALRVKGKTSLLVARSTTDIVLGDRKVLQQGDQLLNGRVTGRHYHDSGAVHSRVVLHLGFSLQVVVVDQHHRALQRLFLGTAITNNSNKNLLADQIILGNQVFGVPAESFWSTFKKVTSDNEV
jgi:hypothetical protein